MDLDIIVNPKVTDDGQAVIQVRRFTRLRNLAHLIIYLSTNSLRLLQAPQSSTSRTRMALMFHDRASCLSSLVQTFC